MSRRYGSPILPMTDADLPRANNPRRGGFGSRSTIQLPIFMKRILSPPTLDFETAMWEIVYLLISPRKVYRQLYYHKQTKNTWARDDPSFLILLSLFITFSALAWGFAYSSSVLGVLRLILYMVLVDFLTTGVVISTIGYFFANRFLRQRQSQQPLNIGGELEWAYCFDIHCNSFLVIWLVLYVGQFILLPVLRMNNWVSMFLGNTLYLCALVYYFVITFYGYSILPFLEHTELLLFPIPVLFILWLASLLGFNMVTTMLRIYFGN